MPPIDFWYDFASTYSYVAAMRVERLAQERGVTLRWRPFLLGPIFFDQGLRDSPFNLYPIKGRYMWRDMERLCAREGLPFRAPDPFPQNSLLAARVALAVPDAVRAAFSRAVYRAEFGEGRQIQDRATLAALLDEGGLASASILEAAQGGPVKSALKAATEEAKARGVFGAPSFTTEDGELFWGNDRLTEALDWAAGHRAGTL